MWAIRRHGHWILAFALATSHLMLTSGTVQAGVQNYLDRFDDRSYANDDGSMAWTGPWTEVGEATDPLSGDWQLVEDVGFARYALGKKGEVGLGVQRVADLAGFNSASLVFDYRRDFLPSGKYVEVQVSSTGTAGPWTTVHTISGASPPTTDPAYVPVTLDISGFVSSATAIRFHHPSGSSSFGTPMALYIDNVEIVGDVSNSAPVLTAPDVSGNETSPIGFTATATDPDSHDHLTFSLAGSVPQGASITTDGDFNWTPTEAQGPGAYSFDVVVTDDGTPPLSDTETVTITVHEVNTAPVITNPGNQINGEGDSVSISLSAVDPDVPANTLTWSATNLPPGLSINPTTGHITGVLTYTAAKNIPYATRVTVTEGLVDGTTAFTWTVTDTNRAPKLSPIGPLSGDEGSKITFTAAGSDPDDGDALTFSLEGAVPHGASMSSGGTFTWTPTEAQGPGNYSFDVVVTDDGTPPLSDEATVTVTVQEVNVAPVAEGDRYRVTRGGTFALGSAGVLANDHDPDGHVLSSWVVAEPKHGKLALDADGSFVYTHSGETDDNDSFIYRVSDGNGGHATALVELIVEPLPNRAPIAESDLVTLAEDSVVSFDVIDNDSDPEDGDLTITSVTPPRGGEIVIENSGVLRFIPTRDFNGTARASYTVEDQEGASAAAEITIEIMPVNDEPRAAADNVVLSQYLSQSIPVLANDTDPDGDVLSITAVSAPDRGLIEVSGDDVLYTAPKGWTGITSFTYVVGDGAGGESRAAVTVEVPPQALVAAQQLSHVLGTDQLKSQWVGSIFDSKVDLAISPLMGLQLFVQAFFQSLDGIQLSLALLGVTAVVLAAFSLVSRLPLVIPLGSPRYWSAVLVGRESQLEIHEKPSRASKVIYQLRPATKGIESEPARRLMPRGWIPVETPRGQGWAETDRLTEQVDAQSFMEDDRTSGMVDQLANRLSHGKGITQMLGRRGLIVDFGDGLEVVPPEALGGLAPGGPWWGRQGTFEDEFRSRIVTPFLEAYESSHEISPDSSHSSNVLLPTEILNFRYLTVGGEESNTWLVLFEYEKGRPRIVGILRDE